MDTATVVLVRVISTSRVTITGTVRGTVDVALIQFMDVRVRIWVWKAVEVTVTVTGTGTVSLSVLVAVVRAVWV